MQLGLLDPFQPLGGIHPNQEYHSHMDWNYEIVSQAELMRIYHRAVKGNHPKESKIHRFVVVIVCISRQEQFVKLFPSIDKHLTYKEVGAPLPLANFVLLDNDTFLWSQRQCSQQIWSLVGKQEQIPKPVF